MNITMTITISNNIITNKIMYLRARHSVRWVSSVGHDHQHTHTACSSEPTDEYVAVHVSQ